MHEKVSAQSVSFCSWCGPDQGYSNCKHTAHCSRQLLGGPSSHVPITASQTPVVSQHFHCVALLTCRASLRVGISTSTTKALVMTRAGSSWSYHYPQCPVWEVPANFLPSRHLHSTHLYCTSALYTAYCGMRVML